MSELQHRLAAILAADAAGYSRLMAIDDQATVAALDAARAVFRVHIEAQQGRIVDMAGDSVLAVFGTAAGAVAAALAIQEQVDTLADAETEDRRMRFRIGVHLGDVIEKADGTVYGDGVNIAARLEGLAEPGGVTVSDSIRSAVKGKVGARFVDQGEQAVKNIADPVRAWRVHAGVEIHEAASASTSPAPVMPSIPEIDLSLPDRPSIAVLPFANMSGNPEQEYFTEGITEDIITELSRFRSLFVIARNSSFAFGHGADVRTVARELGVRYVLEGSIRRAGKRVRVTAQLIEALSGAHLWAERYDRVLEDIFAVQEEVAQAIVAELATQIDSSEIGRVRRVRPGNLGAYELAMQGWAVAWVAMGEASRTVARDEALGLARRALAIDPRCSAALRTIAFAQWQNMLYRPLTAGADALNEGIESARQAIAIDNRDHGARLWNGTLLFYSGQLDSALTDLRRAHEINPNDALALAILAFAEAACGDPKIGVDFAQRALRLSPRDPARFIMLNNLGWSHFWAGDYAQGASWAQRAIDESPDLPAPHMCLMVNCVGSGDLKRAKSELQVMNRLAPEMVETRLAGQWMSTNVQYRLRATIFLRIAAGLEDPGAANSLR